MSDHQDPAPSAAVAVPPPQQPPGPPVVRLQMWVVIVLLLTLFASCAAAGQTVTTDEGPASDPVVDTMSDTELRDLCALLGAVASAQGVSLDATFAGTTPGQCQDAARQSAGR